MNSKPSSQARTWAFELHRSICSSLDANKRADVEHRVQQAPPQAFDAFVASSPLFLENMQKRAGSAPFYHGAMLSEHLVAISLLWEQLPWTEQCSSRIPFVTTLKPLLSGLGSVGGMLFWSDQRIVARVPMSSPVRPLWVASMPVVTLLNLADTIMSYLPVEGRARVSVLPWSEHDNANHALVLKFLPRMAQGLATLECQDWALGQIEYYTNVFYGNEGPVEHALPLNIGVA